MIVWKDIKGYEGIYQISNYEDVKRLAYSYIDTWGTGRYRYKPERLMTCNVNKFGYKMIDLRIKGVRKRVYVHRLVAQAFIPNPNNLPQVNHKDENKLNNCVSNLEWCTHAYNQRYGTKNERMVQTRLKNGTYIRKDVERTGADMRTRTDILIAIVNNIKDWDWDIRSSFQFEKHECEVILELAKKELENVNKSRKEI